MNGEPRIVGHGFWSEGVRIKSQKSSKHVLGSVDSPVSFGGVTFAPGHFVYRDDGILVWANKLTES
ncbi:MAG TPA: hypothetical protein VN982_16125 [Candidatus Dormibacteraeota bacterium]|nr:hypothetical protein [Candidatus Dormibacteraeota bacterium]